MRPLSIEDKGRVVGLENSARGGFERVESAQCASFLFLFACVESVHILSKNAHCVFISRGTEAYQASGVIIVG